MLDMALGMVTLLCLGVCVSEADPVCFLLTFDRVIDRRSASEWQLKGVS